MKKQIRSFSVRSLAAGLLSFACLSGQAQTTFSYTGGLQTYTVPPGVTSIRLEAWGAQGQGGNGGLGGYARGDMNVTPGQVLNVYVGGQAGYNGGGLGHAVALRNGGGGSDVRVAPYALADRVIVAGGGGAGGPTDVGIRNGGGGGSGTVGANYAGGGGGDGYGGAGGPGGLNGGTGNTSCHSGGAGGGGLNSGGAPSCNTCYTNTCGQAGALGQGGNSDTWENGICYNSYGGTNGGGGGYYGGGGSSVGNCGGGGGGGGSSWVGTLTNITMTGGIRTLNGQVVITALSAPGAALNFDGTNDQISIAGPISTGSSYTKEAWILVSNSSGSRHIISSPNAAFWITGGIVNAGQGGNGNVVADIATVPASTYVHYAVTYDAPTTTMKLYKNGVLVATNTAAPAYTTEPTFIGSDGAAGFFAGNIDEVRIWNRALCQGEIQNNMSCEIATTGTGLVRNFHFNQGVAAGANAGVTSLTDVSASALNGTLTGFALTGGTSNWIQPGAVVSGISCVAFSNSVSGTVSTQTNVSCNGSSDGSATVSASGLGAYIYSWAPSGGTNATATGLSVGTYTCTISNACGGVTTVTATITQPAVLAVAGSATNISCNGNADGTATATPSGGTAPYTYAWSNGGITQTINSLAQGVYTCTVTCTNGCTATQTVTVTEPSALAATNMQTNVSCNGGSNGDAMVMASGGTPGYSYNWLPSGGTAATATGLSAGTYTCTITDANNCTTTQTVTITDPSAIAATSTTTNASCNGGSDGSATVAATGGTPGYTYNWAPTGGTNATATGLSAGTYTCTITDANSCVMTQTVLVSEPDALLATPASTGVLCNGGNSGSASVVVFGGTSPYTYAWAPAGGTNATATGLAAGTYTCTITDVNGCSMTQTVSVTQPAALAASITTVTNPIFCGGTNGSVDLTVNGGTAGYTYFWSNVLTTQDISGLSAGTYSVVVTDANNCTTTTTVTLTDPNPPTVTLSLPITTVCAADGAYALSGGTPAGGFYSGPGVTGTIFTPANASIGLNTITYSYTDVNTGCTGTITDQIFVDGCIGIVEATTATNFSLFPNPNNGTFTLQLNTTSISDVLIYDALGQLVSSEKMQPNMQHQINLTDKGVYLITVITAEGQRSAARVVVSK